MLTSGLLGKHKPTSWFHYFLPGPRLASHWLIMSNAPNARAVGLTNRTLITSPPSRWVKYAISVSVCVSVCLLAYLKNHMSEFHEIFSAIVIRGRGSFLLCRPRRMLCTPGFVDDVTFSHNGGNRQQSSPTLCFVEFARWRHRGKVWWPPLPC